MPVRSGVRVVSEPLPLSVRSYFTPQQMVILKALPARRCDIPVPPDSLKAQRCRINSAGLGVLIERGRRWDDAMRLTARGREVVRALG